jgi:hypothetical protein
MSSPLLYLDGFSYTKLYENVSRQLSHNFIVLNAVHFFVGYIPTCLCIHLFTLFALAYMRL